MAPARRPATYRAPALLPSLTPRRPRITPTDPDQQTDTPQAEKPQAEPPRSSRSAQRRRARVAPSRTERSSLWPIATVASLLFAVAGWTAVVVLVLTRPPADGIAATTPTPDTPAASIADTTSHDAPELEALLPSTVQGVTLTSTSWLGGAILGSDDWSQSLTAFLATRELSPDDLKIAQAYDPSGGIDLAAVAFQAGAVEPNDLVSAIVDAWRVDYPGLQTATETVGGKSVTKGTFPEEPIVSYWYTANGIVFEVDTSDPAVAAEALGALP